MAICAMMCGFDTWSEITLFAQEREPWFRRYCACLAAFHHTTHSTAFCHSASRQSEIHFQAWIGDIMGDENWFGQLAVDGKSSCYR